MDCCPIRWRSRFNRRRLGGRGLLGHRLGGRDRLIPEQGARPATLRQDRIELGAVHRHLCAEVEPGEDAEHQRERAVRAVRLLDVIDEQSAE